MSGSSVILAALICSILCWGQIEKPSPVPSRNKKQAAEAPSEKAPDKKKQENNPPQSGEAQRSATVNGSTGLACYFRPKPDAAGNAGTLRAAHPTLATGTKVRVTNTANSKAVVVTVTDHAELGGRIISVSQDAADQLGFVRAGTTQVRLEVLP